MKSYLRGAALLTVYVFAATQAWAQCPEGKTEVELVTPNGVTKTVCLADKARPGIENAPEHTPLTIIDVACPCLNVWDGAPYPANTATNGTPPLLPTDFTGAQCAVANDRNVTTVYAFDAEGIYVAIHQKTSSQCRAESFAVGNHAKTLDMPSQFAEELVGDGVINDPKLLACKRVLESRGCNF